ncbi:MAG: hypothetical protein JRJ42_04770 [Deltaproteobacteria bacterium]|nr:hypothetical protein [Deltaproteobacteria bacterium]MBW2073763.1 hypothetical protein [Deltaproteobacteria bacterium]
MFSPKRWINKFDRWMMAITFAEAGEQKMALDIMNEKPRKKRVGLKVRQRSEQRPVLRA